jgi:hypothetical protein
MGLLNRDNFWEEAVSSADKKFFSKPVRILNPHGNYLVGVMLRRAY